MADDTRALDSLQAQVDMLKQSLKDALAELKDSNKERKEFADALTETAAERDAIQAAVGGDQDKLTAAEKRAAELEAKIRERAHYDKFAELAKEAKAKPGALKHLWEVSKYEAKDDEPDAKALGKMVAELRKSADYAFSPEVTPEEQAATDANARRAVAWSGAKYGIVPGQTPEPAGAGRSARNSGGDGTLITAEMALGPEVYA